MKMHSFTERVNAAEDTATLTGWVLIVNVLSHQIPTQHEESGRGQPSEEVLRRLGMKVVSKQVWMMKELSPVCVCMSVWFCIL